MAEGKKSFVLYSDQRSIIEMLPNDKAGILLKHIFAYVNDENPINEDPLVMLAFEPIKLQMKRDLVKWEEKIENRSSAGMKSAGKRSFDKWLIEAIQKGVDKISVDEHKFEAGRCAKYMNESHGTSMYYHYQYAKEYHEQMATNPTSVESVQQTSTNPTVNDNVNVTVNVNDTVNDIKKNSIDERKLKFASTLKPFVDVYGKELMNEFYSYWTEPNKSNTKFKQELEKTWSLERRLETWAKNDKNFKSKSNAITKQPISVEQRNAEYLAETIRTLREQTDSVGSCEDSPNRSDDFTTFEIMQE